MLAYTLYILLASEDKLAEEGKRTVVPGFRVCSPRVHLWPMRIITGQPRRWFVRDRLRLRGMGWIFARADLGGFCGVFGG